MTEPLNIFIDTCILHEDYFFHNKSNRQLFDYMKEGSVNIFMSNIVLKELRRHYELELEQANYEIEKLIKDAKRLQFKTEIESLDKEAMLKRFDDNYVSLAATDYFHILYYSNDMLPAIIENAIYKNLPFFTDKKSEIKDNLIWMTYSAFVENKKLNNCFLLSNNVTDFCDKDNHSIVHKELRSDTERFTIYKSTASFLAENARLKSLKWNLRNI